ncbi:MAG: alpha/beta hydrolase [Candidatus Microthrix sp.]|nr:alpha/beta hydrolase [Candidatus Microthrix sp.]MBK7321562.1 alpha/beta hydrolase [Candidatus Microthrix sp.]
MNGEDARLTYRTSSLEHEGHRLVYDEYGSGDSVVVYLHGCCSTPTSTGHRRRWPTAKPGGAGSLGHGRSDSPAHAAEYRIDSYAEQVIGLLDHLGVERAVLGGLSLGANVSLFAAVEHPERVQGLVLEMPVLEWAVPFSPLCLRAHVAGRPLRRPVMRRDVRCGEAPSKTPHGAGQRG